LRCARRAVLEGKLEKIEESFEAEEEPGAGRSSWYGYIWDWLPTMAAFLAIYLLLIGYFRPDLIFSLTTTSGGDTGAHHYPAQYLIQELLPNWRLTGWAPGWYAGMPMLTFYFPFPFLLIAILDYILPYTIAFKLVTILGVFLLPLTVYTMARLWRVRKPYPVLAAVFAAAFLFMERSGGDQLYSIYGGNILSTLAGEFGYMLSFALFFLFLGTAYRGLEKPRLNMWFVLNSLLLMALALSHVVTTIVLVVVVPGLLLPRLLAARPDREHLGLSEAGYLVALAAYLFTIVAYLLLPVWAFALGAAVLVAGLVLGICWPIFTGQSRATNRSLLYLGAVGVVGFCLVAFWALPFVANMTWTAHMRWDQLAILSKPVSQGAKLAMLAVGGAGLGTIVGVGVYAGLIKRRIFPLVAGAIAVTLIILALIMLPFLSSYLIPHTWQFVTVFVIGILGMVFAFARKESRMLPLAWLTVVSFVLYAALPDKFSLWNGRLLSFWYFSFYVWAAYGITWFLRCFMVILWDLIGVRTTLARRFYKPFIAVTAVVIVAVTSTVGGGWIQWNYSGYEKKSGWTEYRQILDYMEKIGEAEPHARIMVEHGDKLDQFGTPRAFEIIPYWTQADTMEGTLMEASYTAAFHFINQRELSEQPSNAIIGVEYPSDIDVTRGITHLQLMNIPYFLAFYNDSTSERVIPAVEADSRAELLATFGDYRIYHITGCSGYVEIMKNEPVRVKVEAGIPWRDMAVEWYKNAEALDTPIVWDNGEEALKQFASVTPEQAVNPPEVPITTQGTVSNVKFENESLSFDTTAIGEPHWIKISYFPNWHVKGADGPYLASPSMMMVIPTSGHVELYYGSTWANIVGQTLEVIAWALLLGITAWTVVVVVRRKRHPAPEGPEEGTASTGASDEAAPTQPPALPAAADEYESEDQDILDFEDDPPRR
jgi:hypothetical protein